MDYSCTLIAYVNDIDTIIIENNVKCNEFFLNDSLINAEYIKTENNKYFYKYNCILDYQKKYILKDIEKKQCIVLMNLVVKKDEFDKKYFYDKDDLGCRYFKNYATFKVWAPIAYKAVLKYIINNETFYEEMVKSPCGIYEVTIHKDLSRALYCYILSYNGIEVEVNDIYSLSCNENSKMSAVIDISKLVPCEYYPLKEVKKLNEAIIYEVSIRDFSSDGSLGNDVKYKFNAFLKEKLRSANNNPIGLDYLIDLGVSHIQLLPVLDFASVDEMNVDKAYNWGYDPVSYNNLEGSFSTNPTDPYSRVNEFRMLINKLHEHGLRVCVDLVFNHTYLTNDSIFNKLVPNYYYLMDEDGNYSNGSYCGNDLDTTRLMYKKHVVDMCVRLVRLYNIDGIRLDLMGILSIDTINEIYKACKKINSSFILYGEGWNMPSLLKEEKRASIYNNEYLPAIGFFNDSFRDTIRGKSFGSDMKEKGFISGNSYKAYHAVRAMRGCVERNCYFNEAYKSINYVECHDNATLYDKLLLSNPENSANERNKIQLCMIAATLFAQGTPFLHMGVEFNRTKMGHENSYNLPDSINQIKWKDIDKYQNNIKAVKDYIKVRKENPFFYLNDKKTIVNSIDGEIIDNKYIKLTYAHDGKVAVLIFNPTKKKITLDLKGEYYLYCNLNGLIKDDRTYQEAKLESYSFAIYIK